MAIEYRSYADGKVHALCHTSHQGTFSIGIIEPRHEYKFECDIPICIEFVRGRVEVYVNGFIERQDSQARVWVLAGAHVRIVTFEDPAVFQLAPQIN